MKSWAVGVALLVTAAVGMGLFAVAGAQGKDQKAKVWEAKSDLMTFQELLLRFSKDCGRYPTTSEGLAALFRKPKSGLKGWRGPYGSLPIGKDQWQNRYRYSSKGKAYVLTSFGADGKPGGKGPDKDLSVKGKGGVWP